MKLSTYGGGPNAIGQAVISDERGVVVSINGSPDGWAADRWRRIKRDEGKTYDAHRFTVKLTPKTGRTPIELRDAWTAFETVIADEQGDLLISFGRPANAIRIDDPTEKLLEREMIIRFGGGLYVT